MRHEGVVRPERECDLNSWIRSSFFRLYSVAKLSTGAKIVDFATGHLCSLQNFFLSEVGCALLGCALLGLCG